jgi:predicted lysophospholipase L1 biosynthesis ABC-type transport system permease subunit
MRTGASTAASCAASGSIAAEGQPQVRQTLDRARHFLTLVALLTALLAAVAIAMAAQRYMRRHLDGCATMRCLGVSRRTLARCSRSNSRGSASCRAWRARCSATAATGRCSARSAA